MMIHEVPMANVICSRTLIVPRLQKHRGIQDFLSQEQEKKYSASFSFGSIHMAGK
jgi:hypothetical protein